MTMENQQQEEALRRLRENERAIFKVSIETGESEWRSLPAELKQDITFAKSIAYFPNVGVTREILLQFSVLRHDREYWDRIIETLPKHAGALRYPMGRGLASSEIRADPQFMLKVCRKDAPCWRYVEGTLHSNRDFASTLLHEDPRRVTHMPHQSQVLFPDLVVEQFASLEKHDDIDAVLRFTIAPQIWDCRDNILKWLNFGFPFGTRTSSLNGFPVACREDHEIFTLVAKKCKREHRAESFAQASISLRSNKEFMLAILEIDPSLFPCATAELQHDFDVQILGFSGSRETVLRYMQSGGSDLWCRNEVVVGQFCERAHELLAAHETFTTTVLFAISSAGSGSPLSLLDQGSETALSHKRLIAEFVEVPTGRKLRHLRQAYENANTEHQIATSIWDEW